MVGPQRLQLPLSIRRGRAPAECLDGHIRMSIADDRPIRSRMQKPV